MPKKNPRKSIPHDPIPEQSQDTSVLSPERQKTLVNEIVNEIRKDSLKDAALAQLGKSEASNAISKFFQHPAALLVLGFALTGLIGAWITSSWQRAEWDRQKDREAREWERQQLRLTEIRGIDLKYGIIDEVTKAVGEYHAAAKSVRLPLLKGLNDAQLARQEVEPIKAWGKAYHDWLVSEQILRLKLTAHIKNQDALSYFERIAETEKNITGKVGILQNHLSEYSLRGNNSEAIDYLDDLDGQFNVASEDLKRLVSIIAKEAEADALQNSGQ